MKKNGLEWTVFALGLALVVVLVGYLIREALGGAGGEARFRVRLGESVKVEGGYQTRVTVENVGDKATMAVHVEVEDVELDFDYVPRHSVREGVAVTEKPPKEGRVVGWQEP